jgi:serine phosphatase RsbU (regulator of sigma subunit)
MREETPTILPPAARAAPKLDSGLTLEDRVAAASAPIVAAPARWSRVSPTIRDFLTDGSVPALCDELSSLTGVPIWVRDREGEVIIPEPQEHGGGKPWSIVEEETGARRAVERVGRRYDPRMDLLSIPIEISTGMLGWLVMPMQDAHVAPDGSPAGGAGLGTPLHRALSLLASSVSEVCEAQVAVMHRVHELEALYRLSSLLAQAGDVDRLLGVALDLAIDVLRMDGGSIAVIEPDMQDLSIRAFRGVSQRWVASTQTLTSAGALRKAALAGEVVTVEDMRSDPRIVVPELVRDEGLHSLISTGLLAGGRSIGLLRLYSRSPRRFTQAERGLLKSVADQSAAAVLNARLRVLREEDERIQRQVRLAADVQRRMMPRAMPHVPRLDLAAKYLPSFELGGDFYDFIELGDHLGIVVGDVAGKGVAAALLMADVRGSLRAHAQDVYDIGEVLSRVNAALVRDTRDNEFATLWYGVIDPQTLRLTYCGAGHEWPLVIRVPRDRPVNDEDLSRLTADGMALGIDPSQRYPHGVCQLRAGDVLVVFTDGLPDATDFEGRHFGGTRLRRALIEFLSQQPSASAAQILEHVLWVLRQFTGLSRRIDDITLVVMRVRESA